MNTGLRILVLIGACAALLPLSALASWNVEALMQALATEETGEMQYTETKHMGAITTPLVSEGLLRSDEDGRMEMEVLSPQWAKFVITAETFTMLRKDKPPREIDLASEPRLAAFAAAFRATRNGDLALLREHYKLDLGGSAQDWQLRLTPRGDDMARHISHVDLFGSHGLIRRIVTQQRDGDRSDMQLTPTP